MNRNSRKITWNTVYARQSEWVHRLRLACIMLDYSDFEVKRWTYALSKRFGDRDYYAGTERPSSHLVMSKRLFWLFLRGAVSQSPSTRKIIKKMRSAFLTMPADRSRSALAYSKPLMDRQVLKDAAQLHRMTRSLFRVAGVE